MDFILHGQVHSAVLGVNSRAAAPGEQEVLDLTALDTKLATDIRAAL
jgi:hypothetical protein